MIFFCPTTKLVEQQYARLETWFPDISTESLIGGDEEDKPKIEVLLTQKTKRGNPMCQVSAMPINRHTEKKSGAIRTVPFHRTVSNAAINFW